MAKKGLPVIGTSDEPSAEDREFLEQAPEISTPEFLQAVLEDRQEDVAKMIVHDDRLVKSRDPSGATAIQLAVYHGLDDMLGVLLRSEVELDAFEAAAVGDAERVRRLLDQDPERLSAFSEDGFPLLGLAAFFGRIEVFELLLERGADPAIRARNPARVMPIHSAVAHRDAERSLHMVKRLLDAGVELEVEQAGGFRPLHQAAAAGRMDLVELFLAKGADPEAESDAGQTPLDLARERGHEEVIQRLG